MKNGKNKGKDMLSKRRNCGPLDDEPLSPPGKKVPPALSKDDKDDSVSILMQPTNKVKTYLTLFSLFNFPVVISDHV